MNLPLSIKQLLLKVFVQFQNHEVAQQALNDSINLNTQNLGKISNQPCPYFAAEPELDDIAQRDDIVFINSRFRSGSTVLWNVFRNIENCTAYYEPFNERRWFDENARGDHVDATHIGVDDYSKEYNGLGHLDKYYREDWINSALFMDEKAWDPQMKNYICELVKHASGRPILQFNRIDFRIPWLKQHFPNAKFIHLYRHPRDQWFSFLTDKKLMNKDDVQHTYQDAFYLDIWCDDLAKHFPFLDSRHTPHPYQRFYYLWKLSFLYGQSLCDQSIAYETLSAEPEATLIELFNTLDIDLKHLSKAASVLEKPRLDKWKNYADEAWFSSLESECERNLNSFLSEKES